MMRAVLATTMLTFCVSACSDQNFGTNAFNGPSTSSSTRATAADLVFCVQDINAFRATVGRPPLSEYVPLEAFAGLSAQEDADAGTAHSHFNATNGGGVASAENELLTAAFNQSSTVQAAMHGADAIFIAEGPSGDHYKNLVGPYAQVGCGVFIANGAITVVQDFR
jgi:hypothetical protein